MKILLPVDNSPLSEHAVSFVASRASLLGENPKSRFSTFRLPSPTGARCSGRKKSTRITMQLKRRLLAKPVRSYPWRGFQSANGPRSAIPRK